jgi:hypothetical protein
MKICHIIPADYVEACNQNSSTHLLIAQEVLRNPAYRKNYLERSLKGDFIIMDTGSFEYGNPAPIEDIIKAYEAVQASEIVLPDCNLDGKVTFERILDALEKLEKGTCHPKSLMAVPQGKTEEEYMRCLYQILQIPEINTIGFSYGTMGKAFEKFDLPQFLLRSTAISYVNDHFDLRNSSKNFHCLGIGGHPMEVEFLKLFGFIRSADSSTAFACAIKGIDVKETLPVQYTKPERIENYFNAQVSDEVLQLALKNIETMEEYNKE